MSRRRITLLVALLCCPVAAFGSSPTAKLPVNLYGAPTKSADGARISYGRSELAAQASAASAPAPSVVQVDPGIPAVWSYALMGTGIGYSNFLIGRAGGKTEIYAGGSTYTFGLDTYWYALRYTPSTGNYDQVFVSGLLPAEIVRMGLADVIGGK